MARYASARSMVPEPGVGDPRTFVALRGEAAQGNGVRATPPGLKAAVAEGDGKWQMTPPSRSGSSGFNGSVAGQRRKPYYYFLPLTTSNKLQWGRRWSATETSSASSRCWVRTRCFNGAVAGQRRKRGVHWWEGQQGRRASMGPSLVSDGNGTSSPQRAGRQTRASMGPSLVSDGNEVRVIEESDIAAIGFNGAVAGQRRKPEAAKQGSKP